MCRVSGTVQDAVVTRVPAGTSAAVVLPNEGSSGTMSWMALQG